VRKANYRGLNLVGKVVFKGGDTCSCCFDFAELIKINSDLVFENKSLLQFKLLSCSSSLHSLACYLGMSVFEGVLLLLLHVFNLLIRSPYANVYWFVILSDLIRIRLRHRMPSYLYHRLTHSSGRIINIASSINLHYAQDIC